MKITRWPDDSLEIQERWTLLKTGCVIGGMLLPVLIILAEINGDSTHGGRIAGGVLGTIFLLWLAAFVRDRRFFFDAAQKMLVWEQRNWFGAQGGRLPFSEIRQVLVTSQRNRDNESSVGGYGVQYSAILVTDTGTIPLTGSHSSNKQEYEGLVATILSVLTLPHRTPKSEDEIGGLIAAGRMIDAVALIRARKGLDLSQARELAEEIQRSRGASLKERS